MVKIKHHEIGQPDGQHHNTHPLYPFQHPDAAFQHLFCHTLHAVPTDHPYTVALDGTTVPRTGISIPGAHWTPNPANAPFAHGLRKAQRFTRAGWLDDDPNARCVPIYWLPTFSSNPTRRERGMPHDTANPSEYPHRLPVCPTRATNAPKKNTCAEK
jgi:hypothetical protein